MSFVSPKVSQESAAQLPGLKSSSSHSSFTRQAAELRLKLHALTLTDRRPCFSSECSTVCPSPDCSDASSEPADPTLAAAECLIIFDWDDTLLPTSWIRKFPASPASCAMGASLLRQHAILVEETLRAACRLGRVAIVTLGEAGWVTSSCREFMPGVESLIAELGILVYYSRDEDCPGAWDRKDYALLKRTSMERCIWGRFPYALLKRTSMERCMRTWCSSHPELNGGAVLSIGDSSIEQEALEALLADPEDSCAKKLHCKTLKLMDSPRLSDLGEQLRQLTQLLPKLVGGKKSFSFSVVEPHQLTNLHGF